jgi:hypothetical protein
MTVPSRLGRTTDVIRGFKALKDYVTKYSPPVTVNGGPSPARPPQSSHG